MKNLRNFAKYFCYQFWNLTQNDSKFLYLPQVYFSLEMIQTFKKIYWICHFWLNKLVKTGNQFLNRKFCKFIWNSALICKFNDKKITQKVSDLYELIRKFPIWYKVWRGVRRNIFRRFLKSKISQLLSNLNGQKCNKLETFRLLGLTFFPKGSVSQHMWVRCSFSIPLIL